MADPPTAGELAPARLAVADATLHPGTAAALLALTAEVHLLRTHVHALSGQVAALGGEPAALAGWPAPDAPALVRLVLDRLLTEAPR